MSKAGAALKAVSSEREANRNAARRRKQAMAEAEEREFEDLRALQIQLKAEAAQRRATRALR